MRLSQCSQCTKVSQKLIRTRLNARYYVGLYQVFSEDLDAPGPLEGDEGLEAIYFGQNLELFSSKSLLLLVEETTDGHRAVPSCAPATHIEVSEAFRRIIWPNVASNVRV